MCKCNKAQVGFMMAQGCEDIMPKRAHEDDAGIDLRSKEDLILLPSEIKVVGSGMHIELPRGYEAQVRPRSGLAAKHGITVLNSPGTVDAGYTDEVGVILMNCGNKTFTIMRGDRIAQMVINQLPDVQFTRKASFAESDRGDSGFGESGIA
jgi:dUTP pyrophosphatase